MGEELATVTKDMTLQQQQSAVLDASGFDAPQIASVLNVHQKTVQGWRRDAAYKKAVEVFEARQIAELEPIVNAIRVELGAVIVKSIRKIDEALDAQTKDGRPNWNVQLRAAIEALGNVRIVATPPNLPDEDGGEGERQPASAVIKIELDDGDR